MYKKGKLKYMQDVTLLNLTISYCSHCNKLLIKNEI